MRFVFKFLLIFVLVTIGCNKEKNYTSAIIGHAGNGLEFQGSLFHDNSKESVELALSYEGCSGVEVDLHLSKDHTIWLYHDPFLDDITNLSGCVNDLSDEHLMKGVYNTSKKEKLVMLNEIDFGTKTVFFDLKHYNYCQQSIVDVSIFIDRLNAYRLAHPNTQFNIVTTNQDYIQPFLDQNWEVFFELKEGINFNNLKSNFPDLHFMVKNKSITHEQVQSMKNESTKIAIFEVRAPKSIKGALAKNPDFLLSDDVRSAIVERY